MVNGRLYCLGPLQHLKNKFSQGYTLIVKCKDVPARSTEVANIKQFILDNFKEARHIESYMGISTFYILDSSLLWWEIFSTMEEACKQYPIEDYSVSQTTLEQVFLRFSRMQSRPDV
ncbi:unnamed protein product [Leptidea sinapis]|uniref:ABCA1-4-like C-terminal R2 regulatory domain-containing protein n=2 Tax=Leptidea sinapis TaxID=189913 RepID=A0A5E4Q9M6_9NEOP|nr:unnamed protein product [Leptidea sinapis]